jgi:hypothetical protein
MVLPQKNGGPPTPTSPLPVKNWKYVAIETPETWKKLYVKLNKNNPWLCWKLITAWKNIFLL